MLFSHTCWCAKGAGAPFRTLPLLQSGLLVPCHHLDQLVPSLWQSVHPHFPLKCYAVRQAQLKGEVSDDGISQPASFSIPQARGVCLTRTDQSTAGKKTVTNILQQYKNQQHQDWKEIMLRIHIFVPTH